MKVMNYDKVLIVTEHFTKYFKFDWPIKQITIIFLMKYHKN